MRRPVRRAAAGRLRIPGCARAAQAGRAVPGVHPAPAGDGLPALSGAAAFDGGGAVAAGPERQRAGSRRGRAATKRVAQPDRRRRTYHLRLPYRACGDLVAIATARGQVSGIASRIGRCRHRLAARARGACRCASALRAGGWRADARAGAGSAAAVSGRRRWLAQAVVRTAACRYHCGGGAWQRCRRWHAGDDVERRCRADARLCRRRCIDSLRRPLVQWLPLAAGIFRLSGALSVRRTHRTARAIAAVAGQQLRGGGVAATQPAQPGCGSGRRAFQIVLHAGDQPVPAACRSHPSASRPARIPRADRPYPADGFRDTSPGRGGRLRRSSGAGATLHPVLRGRRSHLACAAWRVLQHAPRAAHAVGTSAP